MVRQVQTLNSVSGSLAKLQEIVDSLSATTLFLKCEMDSFKSEQRGSCHVFDPSHFWHGFPETLTVKR